MRGDGARCRSEAEIDRVLADIARRHGRIDVMVANAGINIRRTAVDCSLDDWNAVLQVNLTGVFLVLRPPPGTCRRAVPWSSPRRS
ncbi:MAG: SDR family NAD(P)-dependent oxidoreductase [Geminicoccaceae bacterium]